MSLELRIVDDVMAAVATELAAALPNGPVVLTGGSTVNAYAAVPAETWTGARLWFSDERCVPVSDERSNFGAIAAAVLDPVASANVAITYCERMRGEEGPEAGATAYEQVLREHGVPEQGFELLILGLGPDSHIASMFPGQDSLDERKRLVVGVAEAGHEPFVPRITLTFPALSLARRVLVVAAGSGKADAVSTAFAEDAPVSREVPASLLAEYCQSVTVLVDDDSAARL